MILDAFYVVLQAIGYVLVLFDQLMQGLDSWKYIFGLIIAMFVFRFVIYPFLKVAVVDNDKKSKKGE